MDKESKILNQDLGLITLDQSLNIMDQKLELLNVQESATVVKLQDQVSTLIVGPSVQDLSMVSQTKPNRILLST